MRGDHVNRPGLYLQATVALAHTELTQRGDTKALRWSIRCPDSPTRCDHGRRGKA
jgi:hypothetical protein